MKIYDKLHTEYSSIDVLKKKWRKVCWNSIPHAIGMAGLYFLILFLIYELVFDFWLQTTFDRQIKSAYYILGFLPFVYYRLMWVVCIMNHIECIEKGKKVSACLDKIERVTKYQYPTLYSFTYHYEMNYSVKYDTYRFRAPCCDGGVLDDMGITYGDDYFKVPNGKVNIDVMVYKGISVSLYNNYGFYDNAHYDTYLIKGQYFFMDFPKKVKL